jgi:hypothetical protein
VGRSGVNTVLEPRWSRSLIPLFSEEKERRRVRSEAKREELTRERARYQMLDAPSEILGPMAEELRSLPEVASAYVKPGVRIPQFPSEPAEPWDEDILRAQPYLGSAATGGIEARFAHGVDGGDGESIHVVDLEWSWDFDHEDLKAMPPRHQVLYGTAWNPTDHGTAILGMLGAIPDNGIGIAGICPGAKIDTAVFEEFAKTSTTIDKVTSLLTAGDIIVIPFERPGPAFGYDKMNPRGGIPLEWWNDDRVAIETAVNAGIIVVCAAGNGREDLGRTLYDERGVFPPEWTNPFRRNPDSGSIYVGAGAPPRWTNGIDWGPDCSRIVESNHGRMVDAQGWGHEVTTLGYGNLVRPGASTKHEHYTMRFGMTSAASAMVAGALACAQGARRKQGKSDFDSFTARDALRNTGTKQQWVLGSGTDTIGNRPNLRELLVWP